MRMIVACVLVMLAGMAAAAPVVVETSPALGARDVDPGLAQIRVTFSEPMRDGSWSWCGGGYAYPEITASPFYEDERTVVLPVKLESQHTYVLSINCPSAMGFRSAAGVSVEPYTLRFTTTWGDPLLASADPANMAALQELRKLLAEQYSYADRLGYDWREALESERDFLLSAPTAREWAMRLVPVLEPFHDKHLRLVLPDGEAMGTWFSPGRYNGNAQAIERTFGPLTQHGRVAVTGRRDGMAYVAIHSWTGDAEDTTLFHELLDEAMDTPVLILDVRANGGGDEVQARGVAARFLRESEGGTYARNRLRDGSSPDGWTPWYDRVVHPGPADKHISARVLLLQGSVCLSSNESFIKMMRLSPRVTTIGATTGGSSARPQGYQLANGIQILLPSWWSTLPDGMLLEGNGIAPDVAVDGDFVVGDPVLQKAMEMAKETGVEE